MKEFWVKGRFCRDLRVICPKSASSSNRLYHGGQWINAPETLVPEDPFTQQLSPEDKTVNQ